MNSEKNNIDMSNVINKLFEGDCLEYMKKIPDGSVDMILCDLPYGMTLVLCQDLAQNKMRSFATKLLTENRPSHTFFQSR